MLTSAFLLTALLLAAPPGRESVIGEAASVEASERKLTVKRDDGGQVTVTFDEKTAFLRALPGASSLAGATPVQPADVKTGDRLLCRGTLDAATSTLAANRVVVMARSDVESRRQKEQEDWQKRGLAGVVTAVDATAHELTLRVVQAGTTKPVVVETGGANVSFRRYAPTSVRFADAKPSSFAEIAVGDQLRVLGNRNADATRVVAEQVVSGAFRVVRGTVTEVDAVKGTLSVREGDKGPAATVAVGGDTVLRRLPTMMVMRLLRASGAVRGRPGRRDGGGAQGLGWRTPCERSWCARSPARRRRSGCGRVRPSGRSRRGPRAPAGDHRQGRVEGRRDRDPRAETGGRQRDAGDQGRGLDPAADASGRRPWRPRRRGHGRGRRLLGCARHGRSGGDVVVRLTAQAASGGCVGARLHVAGHRPLSLRGRTAPRPPSARRTATRPQARGNRRRGLVAASCGAG